MAAKTLEQIDKELKAEQSVPLSDINDACDALIAKHKEDYSKKPGNKVENFEKDEKEFIDRAREKRDEQIRARQAVETKRTQREAQIKERSREARKWGWNVSGTIQDYEGYDLAPWNHKEESQSKGRTLLSGYLAALRVQDPTLSDKALAQAKEEYEKSAKGWSNELWKNWDSHLSNDKVHEIIGNEHLQKAANQSITLGNQAKGFLAGYYKIAKDFFKDPADQAGYDKYLSEEIQKLINERALYYEAKSGQDPLDTDHERSQLQMEALGGLLNPKDWSERSAQQKSSYDAFNTACLDIQKANTGFEFKDTKVVSISTKSAGGMIDKSVLDAAKEAAAKEFFIFAATQKQQIVSLVDENKTKLATLRESNTALNPAAIKDEEFASREQAITTATTELQAITVDPPGDFEKIQEVSKKLKAQLEAANTVKGDLAEVERKIQEVKDKGPSIDPFLNEKKLTEKHEASSTQFQYELADCGFKVHDSALALNFSNPEVTTLLGKVAQFIKDLADKNPLTAEEKKQIEGFMAKAADPTKAQAAMTEATQYAVAAFEKKLSEADAPRFQAVKKIIDQAQKDSILTFDHQPKLAELETAYNEKFIGAWTKAAQSFDALPQPAKPVVAPAADQKSGASAGEKPASAPAPAPKGFLDEPEPRVARQPEPQSMDPYGDHWDDGVDVLLPQELRGYTGGLQVSDRVVSINFRDPVTHRVALAVDGGTGGDENIITLAHPNGKGHHVNNRTYVLVNYQGRQYYAAVEFLQMNTQSLKRWKRGEAQQPAENADALGFLGKVNTEYRDALTKMAMFSESTDGVQFNVFYNKQMVPCTFRKTGPSSYVLQFPGTHNVVTFSTAREAMEKVNGGFIVERMTFDELSTMPNYKLYEESIGTFKEMPRVSDNARDISFELDWNGSGRGEGNAQVWLTVMAYGGISYRVQRTHAGINGDREHTGFAANFEDFMKQLGHVKQWAEGYEDRMVGEMIPPALVREEATFHSVSDPRFYYNAEARIGRPLSFNIVDNDMVETYLDWSGTAARFTMSNPKLSVQAGDDGRLNYSIEYRGKENWRQGTAQTLDEVFGIVAEMKTRLAGKSAQPVLSFVNPTKDTTPAPQQQGEILQVAGPVPSQDLFRQKQPLQVAGDVAQPDGVETAGEEAERRNLIDKLQKHLMLLSMGDKSLENLGRSVERVLNECKKLIEQLQGKYPNDPSLFILRRAYVDLKGDFERGEETELDSSSEALVLEMGNMMKAAGIQKTLPDRLNEMSPSLGRTVQKLRGLNINPAYVVQAPKQGPATKTVVLFMQTHPEPKDAHKISFGESSALNDFLEAGQRFNQRGISAEDSQNRIKESLIAMVRSGLVRTAYEEGYPDGVPSYNALDPNSPEAQEIRKNTLPGSSGVFDAQRVLGNQLDIKGVEPLFLNMALFSDRVPRPNIVHRSNAHNAYMAINLATAVNSSSEEVSVMTFGGLHEIYPSGAPGERHIEHPLPLSHAIAYTGNVNVIVVNECYKEDVS